MKLVDMIYATEAELPPMPAGKLYQYVTAANGVFVRAERPGLRVLIPVNSFIQRPLRGLADLVPYVVLSDGPVNTGTVLLLMSLGKEMLPNEALFHLEPGRFGWTLNIPQQVASPGSVHPADPFCKSAQSAVVEMHTHGPGAAFFSGTDDRDEQGFRIYAVMGRLDERPQIRARVGVYGHFAEIDATEVFDLPQWYWEEEVTNDNETVF